MVVEYSVRGQPRRSAKRKKYVHFKLKRMIINSQIIYLWIIFCNFSSYLFKYAATLCLTHNGRFYYSSVPDGAIILNFIIILLTTSWLYI